jgi:hypothetical protein
MKPPGPLGLPQIAGPASCQARWSRRFRLPTSFPNCVNANLGAACANNALWRGLQPAARALVGALFRCRWAASMKSTRGALGAQPPFGRRSSSQIHRSLPTGNFPPGAAFRRAPSTMTLALAQLPRTRSAETDLGAANTSGIGAPARKDSIENRVSPGRRRPMTSKGIFKGVCATWPRGAGFSLPRHCDPSSRSTEVPLP